MVINPTTRVENRRVARCSDDSKHLRFVATVKMVECWIVDRTGRHIKTDSVAEGEHEVEPIENWACEDCGSAVVEVTEWQCPKCHEWADADHYGPGPWHIKSCLHYRMCFEKNETRAQELWKRNEKAYGNGDRIDCLVGVLTDALHGCDVIRIPFDEVMERAREVYARQATHPALDHISEYNI